MGMKGFATFYQDNEIYQNALTGVIYYIIALVAVGAAVIGFTIGFFTLGLGFILGIAGLVVAFVFYILAASHLRTTFKDLAQKSGEQSFNTAGMLLWWGAILTIIFVGLILIFIAWIFAAIGFFSMKTTQQQPYSSQQQGYTPPPTQLVHLQRHQLHKQQDIALTAEHLLTEVQLFVLTAENNYLHLNHLFFIFWL